MLNSLEDLGKISSVTGTVGTNNTTINDPISCVSVADDTAPSSRSPHPQQALSDLQTLLYVTEAEARQLHIDFGVSKCQLLVTARPGKLRKTLRILKDEPDVLTFYSEPVTVIQPGEHYIHLGVPQAPTNQSNIAVKIKIQNGLEMFYSLQDVLQSSLRGISPGANKFMVNTYIIQGFIYGLDTIIINPTDLDLLETKFRSIIRSLQSLPPSTPTPMIYLMMGILPAVAMRDIEILRLVGQLAICDRNLQNVSEIIEKNLVNEDIAFPGWSGLAKRTAAIYDLEDPLELFQEPWRSDRWSKYAKEIVTDYWTALLKENAATYSCLDLLDLSRLSLSTPHPIWVAAGNHPINIKKTTIVSWLLLGVYKTGERLHKMKKVKTPICVLCQAPTESRVHFGLQCPALFNIRSESLNKFVDLCPNLTSYLSNTELLLLILLDPFSPVVPAAVRDNWSSESDVYKISRNYFYDIHKKREKLMEKIQLEISETKEKEESDRLIFTIYD